MSKRRFSLLLEPLARLNVMSESSLSHIGVLKLAPELAKQAYMK